MDSSDIHRLQTDLNILGEWAVENERRYIQAKVKQ